MRHIFSAHVGSSDWLRCSFVKIRWANDIFELFLSDPEKQQRQLERVRERVREGGEGREMELNQIKSNEMQATTKLSKVSPEMQLQMQLHLYLHLSVSLCASLRICRCICIFSGRSCSHEVRSDSTNLTFAEVVKAIEIQQRFSGLQVVKYIAIYMAIYSSDIYDHLYAI